MRALSSLVSGILLGLGLVISGMSDPARVLGFLDILGAWDPSLAFVMAGAVTVVLVGYRLVLRRPRPLLAERFHLPTRQGIDPPLILGAAIFGVGWGTAGLCPGPAFVALPLLAPGSIAFAAAMLAGMWIARRVAERAPPGQERP